MPCTRHTSRRNARAVSCPSQFCIFSVLGLQYLQRHLDTCFQLVKRPVYETVLVLQEGRHCLFRKEGQPRGQRSNNRDVLKAYRTILTMNAQFSPSFFIRASG